MLQRQRPARNTRLIKGTRDAAETVGYIVGPISRGVGGTLIRIN